MHDHTIKISGSLDEKEESLIKRRRKLELCLERDDASIWKREGYEFLAGCRNLFNAKVPIFLRTFSGENSERQRSNSNELNPWLT